MRDMSSTLIEDPPILKIETDSMDINQKVDHARNLFALASRFREFTGGGQGTGFSGKRDLYASCGWIKDPKFEDFLTWSSRGLGKIINDIKPKATWNGELRVVVPEDDKDNSGDPKDRHPLEKSWAKLSKDMGITEIFLRADKAAGIGNYSIIFLGLNDSAAEEPKNEVQKTENMELISMKVFKQNNCPVKSVDGNPGSDTFGLPKQYLLQNIIDADKRNVDSGTAPIAGIGATTRTIDLVNKEGSAISSTDIPIDASRVIHIAEDLLEDDIYGTPRLLAILNYLQDYEKVTGGSAEMYFRGAFPGWIFSIDKESDWEENDAAQKEQFETEVDQMIYTLKRYVRMQGITPHSLAPQVSDPTAHAKVQLDAISGVTEIPNRKLMGSERGEQASSQDEHNWNGVIDGRRRTDASRWVRDFIDKMMTYGILPFAEEYTIEFPDLSKQDAEKMSKIALNYANAFRAFKMTPGLDQEITFEDYLINFASLPEDLARSIVSTAQAVTDEQDDEIDEFQNDIAGDVL